MEDDVLNNKWVTIAGTLGLGLFVAFLDRINLSVGLIAMSNDLGFAGNHFAVTSSLVLTVFLIGYGFSNFFGGIVTRNVDPKTIVISMMAIWSVCTFLTGWVTSVTLLIVYRLILGVTEGIYWPQQSRFARAWFAPHELSRANSIIHFYGQFFGLGLGFLILTPVVKMLGWRPLFLITGAAGIVVMVPLFMKFLRWESESNPVKTQQEPRARLTLEELGGPSILFLCFTYFAQSNLFWGVSLWIPMLVKSLKFTGMAQAVFSALPYFTALILGAPMSILTDRTGRRLQITVIGLIVPGAVLMFLPHIDDPVVKMAMIALSLGFCASTFQPNIWSIVQSSVPPRGVGPAAGVVNGIGAAGGTVAGFVVGLLYKLTGSYTTGFVYLGLMVMLAGVSLILHDRYKRKSIASSVAATS
jgi:MFS family permease